MVLSNGGEMSSVFGSHMCAMVPTAKSKTAVPTALMVVSFTHHCVLSERERERKTATTVAAATKKEKSVCETKKVKGRTKPPKQIQKDQTKWKKQTNTHIYSLLLLLFYYFLLF
mmetsp:Transcript_6003/g.6563  ORF Transcript_6003/g.6563 Transcript_6003/m.6563 type:complete len:114 (-) Transcript_6003:28-369(-)